MYKICNMYCKASFTSCLKISSISVRRWQSYVRFCDHTHQFALNRRLLQQRAKFSQRVMVSAGVCDSGKGRLHFVDEKVKVNAEYYMKSLLLGLLNDCHTLLGDDFIF